MIRVATVLTRALSLAPCDFDEDQPTPTNGTSDLTTTTPNVVTTTERDEITTTEP